MWHNIDYDQNYRDARARLAAYTAGHTTGRQAMTLHQLKQLAIIEAAALRQGFHTWQMTRQAAYLPATI
ncbi:MAG: hypothetical protein IJT34_05690 [Butyrivibrio sp.]|nr:hypothetical protein [Butyrivibrio sp.]